MPKLTEDFSLVKRFLLFTAFIVTLFLWSLFNITHTPTNTSAIKTFTQIVQIPGFASSSPYLESRVGFYQDQTNRLYPQMRYYKQMDYIYAP